MIEYKIDILSELKKKGINTTRIRSEHLLSEDTLSALRHGKMISFKSLDRICELLQCQPGDLIQYTDISGD